uniref:DUF1653 domain-containing protein n=1 Tax=Heterorhabditis bacteriophora TaxID=37862 RepID=A0A1I7XU56_HETBA
MEYYYLLFDCPREVMADYPLRYDLVAEKRDMNGYGWNDCEFSPLSCLLRRRRDTNFRRV